MQRPWGSSTNGDKKELIVAGSDWEKGKVRGGGDKQIARDQMSHSL